MRGDWRDQQLNREYQRQIMQQVEHTQPVRGHTTSGALRWMLGKANFTFKPAPPTARPPLTSGTHDLQTIK